MIGRQIRVRTVLTVPGWMLLGAFVGLAASILASGGSGSAGHLPGTNYIWWGLRDGRAVYCDPWGSGYPHIPGDASCWHNDEPSNDGQGHTARYSALDYNTACCGGDAGSPAKFYYSFSGTADLSSRYRSLLSGTKCTGLRVDIYSHNGAFKGDMHYLHINVDAGVIGTHGGETWIASPPHYERRMGVLSSTQPSGCGFTGSHLHQSGNTASWSGIWHVGSSNHPPGYDHYVPN